MTKLPIIDISEKLGFSTQQTFTRTFTRHFNIAPGRYREASLWHLKGLMPELAVKADTLPIPEMVKATLPVSPEFSFHYYCSSAKLHCLRSHLELRKEIFGKIVNGSHQHSTACIAEIFEPHGKRDQIKFTMTLHGPLSESYCSAPDAITYLRFPFVGTPAQLTTMQIDIYRYVLPGRGEARTEGHDFFIFNTDRCRSSLETTLHGHYYVPVSA